MDDYYWLMGHNWQKLGVRFRSYFLPINEGHDYCSRVDRRCWDLIQLK